MIIRLGNEPPRTAGQCITCGITKLYPMQALCNCCTVMIGVLAKRNWFIKAHEDWLNEVMR